MTHSGVYDFESMVPTFIILAESKWNVCDVVLFFLGHQKGYNRDGRSGSYN